MFRTILYLLILLTISIKILEAQSEQRVVGGYGAHITSYPFVVSLRRKSCEICSFEHHCGGVIYSQKSIITAASCLKNVELRHIKIIAGLEQSGKVYPVERITLHENDNVDLAIVHLAIEISFDDLLTERVTVARVLPEVGKHAVLVGWGQLNEFDVENEQFKEVHIPLMDHGLCKQLYFWHKVEDHEICAGYLAGGADACMGDAGSPLLFNKQLIGIASWGYGCARAYNPGVYTNTVALREWIRSNA